MTREEALLTLQANVKLLHFEHPHLGLEEAIKVAIEALSEPSLPADLDEAEDAHIRRVADAAGHPGWDWTTQDITDAFIAGAEWMAGQGVKATATVGYYNQSGLSILTEPSIKKLGFKEGDELEITIRKK